MSLRRAAGTVAAIALGVGAGVAAAILIADVLDTLSSPPQSSSSLQERADALQLERIAREVISPLASSSEKPIVVIDMIDDARVSATIARELPRHRIVTEVANEARRHENSAVPARSGARNATASVSSDGAGIGAPGAAVIVLVDSYNSVGGGTSTDRVQWLRHLLQRGRLCRGGHVVIIEAVPGAIPVPAPPLGQRLERSTVIAEAEDAGLNLVDAPGFLRWHSALVFKLPLDE